MKIALASNDGKTVNTHFNSTPGFIIAQADDSGYRITERRENNGGNGLTLKELNSACFDSTIALISDCEAVIAAKIGRAAVSALLRRNIQALEQTGDIEDLLDKYVKYLGKNGYKLQVGASLPASGRVCGQEK